ncbi:MAG: ABC transporter ATP-binding protein [Phycisphaerales bacterium]|nr:ABC transporter ATP-binding protein [Phycisphaerales bacterium]
MLPPRESSRARYREYLAKRRKDRTYAARGTDERATRPDKYKRSRSFAELLGELWRASGRHQRAILFALGTLTLVTCMGLALPASTKFAIDYILTDNPGPSGIPDALAARLPVENREALLWMLGGVLVAIALVAVSIGTVGRWQMTRVTKRVQTELRRAAFERAVALPLHRIQHYKSGGMASLLREDASQTGDLLFSLFYNPWRAVVQFVGTLSVLAWVDWRMLAGALLLLPAVWITHKTWISRIRPVHRDAKYVRQGIDATTTEAFGGMRVVRGFSRERTESTRFTTSQQYLARLEILVWWWSRAVDIAWSVLIPAASALVLAYGGTQVLRGNLTIGDVMMFSTYLLMLLGPLETLTSTAANVQGNLAAFDRVLDLLGEAREFEGERDGRVVQRGQVRGEIEVRDVWFTYPRVTRKGTPGDQPPPEPVIRGISFAARAGTTTALVGVSGSGKTTLCNLIARFYDPQQGSVLLDGLDLREIDVHSYRSLLGIVEQDVFLFDGTIAENIAYARRDAGNEAIRDAARAANADAFIDALDHGYDTLIGERGVRLSGGQKQRIAIARALLADPRILILDEATSNLDSESEAMIQRSLATLMRGRTCFVIAHRLSTIRHADQILVLDQGRVIESGTHEALMHAGGRYADLLRLQLLGEPSPVSR